MQKQCVIIGIVVLMLVFGIRDFTNGDSGHLAVLKSEDNGASWSYIDQVVMPGNDMQPVDPSPLFEGGRIVLYVFDGNPSNDDIHTIYRAESDDGIQFSTPEEVYSYSEYPITDPCVIKLPNDTYRMYLSYGTHTLSATSSDGLTFTSDDGFRTDQAGIPGVILLPSGTYMLYGGGGSNKSISSYTGTDGLNFEPVTTEAIEAGTDAGCETPGCELCDPHPIQLQDGSYLMTYKVRPEGETDPFSDKIFLATSTDGQNWATDGKMIREGSVPAIVQKDDGVLLIYYVDFSSVQTSSTTSSSVPNTTTTPNIPVLEISPLEHDFGEVEVGTSDMITVNIANVGTAELVVDCITFEHDLCEDFSFLDQLPPCDSEEVIHLEPETTIDVTIVYAPSDAGFCSDALEINSNDPEQPLMRVDLKGTGVLTLVGSDYLIITHDDFYSQILPLAQEKEKQGYLTKVVKTSEIGTKPTADEITTYIQNEYKTKNPKPQYVLLVGDVDYLPVHYRTAHNPAEDGTIATDLYYGTMDSSDYLPDLAVGRLPVTSTGETTTIVNKILNYDPQSGTVLLYGDNPEATCAEEDRTTILEPAGFAVDTAYDSAATPTNVVNKINAERMLVAYYGHGSTACSGQFCSNHVKDITTSKIPAVMSGGCFCNQFDHSSSKCLGEELLLAQKGAIGFVGSTRTGGYGYAYKFADGFYQELSQSGQIGIMLNIGRKVAYDAAVAAGQSVGDGSWTKSFIEKINLLGDPELKITPPTCLAKIFYGEDSVEVVLLRNLRDNILNKTPEGRELSRLYYLWSLGIVKAMENDDDFKEDIKEMIDGVLPLIGELPK